MVIETYQNYMIMETYQNYIGGKIVPSNSEALSPLYNPTSGDQTGEVVLSAKEDLAKAVEVAKAAFPSKSCFS